jgi:hypothetical protein
MPSRISRHVYAAASDGPAPSKLGAGVHLRSRKVVTGGRVGDRAQIPERIRPDLRRHSLTGRRPGPRRGQLRDPGRAVPDQEQSAAMAFGIAGRDDRMRLHVAG